MRSTARKTGLFATLALATTALSGCAHLAGDAQQAHVTSVRTPAAPVTREDAYYQGAVSAIMRRDYVAALDLLQAARANRPDDVRVLNAFGVVYDKLGRFDLSARYYAQASALAPNSSVVLANQAYSAQLSRLQTLEPAPQMAEISASPASPAPVLSTKASPEPQRVTPPELAQRDDAPHATLPPPSVSTPMAVVSQHAALAMASRAPLVSVRAALTQAPAPELAQRDDALHTTSPPSSVSTPMLVVSQHAAPEMASRAPLVSVRAAPTQAPAPDLPASPPARTPAPTVLAAAPSAAPTPAAKAPLAQARAAVPWEEKTLPASARVAQTSRPAPTLALQPLPLRAQRPLWRVALSQPKTRFLPHGGLRIVNATGAPLMAEPVRISLASRGWTAPKSAVVAAVMRSRTTIYYQPERIATARALANTLPGITRLSACLCREIQLVLGADVAHWRAKQPTRANTRT